jgi:hypothetical protein
VSPGVSRRSVLEVVDRVERGFMTTLTSLEHKDVTEAKIKSLRNKLTVSRVRINMTYCVKFEDEYAYFAFWIHL